MQGNTGQHLTRPRYDHRHLRAQRHLHRPAGRQRPCRDLPQTKRSRHRGRDSAGWPASAHPYDTLNEPFSCAGQYRERLLYRQALVTIVIHLVVTVSFVTRSAWGEVVCPPAAQGHPLDRMSLFVGNPRNLVELAPLTPPPTSSRCIYDWPLRSSAGLFAFCRYQTGVYGINQSFGRSA